MKYIDVENALFKLKPVFSTKDLELAGFKVYPYELSIWIKRGYIRRLGGGMYVFAKAEVVSEYIANRLREPSYISLESALYYYNLTVDISFHVTSVTTRGTRKIIVGDTSYFYQHVKPTVFNGFVVRQENDKKEVGQRFYIATPEKALVDLFYLNPTKYVSKNNFQEARFHEEEMKKKLDWKAVFSLAALYKNKQLEKRLRDLKDYIFTY